jgi:hypothetical protein
LLHCVEPEVPVPEFMPVTDGWANKIMAHRASAARPSSFDVNSATSARSISLPPNVNPLLSMTTDAGQISLVSCSKSRQSIVGESSAFMPFDTSVTFLPALLRMIKSSRVPRSMPSARAIRSSRR